MKIIMGSHLTNAAKLSNDWGPPLPDPLEDAEPERTTPLDTSPRPSASRKLTEGHTWYIFCAAAAEANGRSGGEFLHRHSHMPFMLGLRR